MDRLFEFLANHPALTGAALLILILIAINEFIAQRRGGQRVGPADAVRLINDQDAVVIDLRSAADFKRGHILGAINVPFARLDAQLPELKKHSDKPVILCCALGSVSGQAGSKLRAAGFQAVHPLAGGLNAWQGASMPVTAK